jgi:hypothetical protein
MYRSEGIFVVLYEYVPLVWGIDIPRVLTITKTYHGPPDGPPSGLPRGMGQQVTIRSGKLDPRGKIPASELYAAKTLISRVMQLRTPEELDIRG